MRVLHVGHGFRPFHHGGLISYAEDLMQAQAARGDEVHYFFSGRHYPLLRTRMRSWERGQVRMHELLNSPVLAGTGDRGTRRPDLELREPTVERLFRAVLDEVRPDLVHVQELNGLPSSLLEIPAERGVPVAMTLHDYHALCPTVKLFDLHGQRCRRREPAPVCVGCCRDAPGDARELVTLTGRHHKREASTLVPLVQYVPGPGAVRRWVRGSAEPARRAAPPGDVAGFQARRDVNVARLNGVDRLLPVSAAVGDLYAELGVERGRLRTLGLTVSHLESLRPRRMDAVGRPVRFVTLNGCASPAKGADVVAGALDELAAGGLTPQDLTLSVAGHVDPTVADRLAASPLVHLLGDYPPAALDEMLDGFDVGIVPSIWDETFGFVAVELLAKGLPLIGNAAGAVADHARDGETGWLNRDCSALGLAGIMAAVVAEPQQVVALNRRIIELRPGLVASMDTHTEQVREVYAELLGQSSSTARSAG